MSLKGSIEQDHLPRNLPTFFVSDSNRSIMILSITELEEAIQTVTLPDRTVRSGGQSDPLTFTIQIPAHHDEDVLYLDGWYEKSKRPMSGNYKYNALVQHRTLDNTLRREYTLYGVFPTSRSIDEQDMENEGEMNRLTFTMSADYVKRTR